MMNENRWLVDTFHHAFPFWVYGTLCLVEILFVWRMVPETKGQSLEEIERKWCRESGPEIRSGSTNEQPAASLDSRKS